ncbi:probable inactive receptor kinase At1g48480 isoform X2 [Momordica charantia]|uniref:Probable inactive receptor kinase At1g48480 isoform X2 n=1 Tax=Momordica charantia TaxID=3673 RepID=A0A6J1CDM1_MOMCH|nr:probable inactive receptor kinase At1g48480 isoform X2 [Momordica charantia]
MIERSFSELRSGPAAVDAEEQEKAQIRFDRGGEDAGNSMIFIRAIDPQDMLGIGTNDLVLQLQSNKVKGVKYSRKGQSIVEIRLQNLNLSGKIDADSVCKLSSLRVLNLAKNNIQGNIPDSIVHCTRLTHLNLSNNNLSGEVPLVLPKLKHLRRLDVSNNHFTTSLPQFMKEFKHGKSLRSWMTRQDMIDVGIKAASPVSSSSQSSQSNSVGGAHWLFHKRIKWMIISIVGIVLFLLLSFFICKRAAKLVGKKQMFQKALEKSPPIVALSAMSTELEQRDEALPELVFFNEEDEQFKVEDLLEATADLQNLNICTSLFKVRLKSQYYAVKTLRKMQINFDEFRKTMRLVGNLQHPNILPLVGYYSANEEKLLIYKYQRNGSLHKLLESCIEGKQKFPWRIRLSIASGIANALGFIYQRRSNAEDSIPHGNLKLSNILLNENNEPQISEYGITKFLDPKRARLLSSKGYTAPEKKLSEKGDVYSFGIILLELLTGKMVAKDGINLPKWVRAKIREEWTCEVFDDEVAQNAEKWGISLLLIALDCVSHYPEGRPTMAEALEKIEGVMKAVEDYEQRISPFSSDFGTPDS